jgi:hypothetical protein
MTDARLRAVEVDVDVFPDLAALSDAELKALIERKVAEELEVSRRRRLLHGQLDMLRAERVNRLRERVGEDLTIPEE